MILVIVMCTVCLWYLNFSISPSDFSTNVVFKKLNKLYNIDLNLFYTGYWFISALYKDANRLSHIPVPSGHFKDM